MARKWLVRWGLWLLAAFASVGAAAGQGGAEKEYEQRAAKLADDDTKGWLALADFCEARLLLPQREAALRKVVAAQADHAEARRRLDEVKVGNEWLLAAEADALAAKDHEEKGEVYYGKGWVAAKTVGAARTADRNRFGWNIQTRVDAPTCIVYSAAPYDQARAVAVVAHRTALGYEALFGKTRKLEPFRPYPIHLFDSFDVFSTVFKRMAKFVGPIPKGFSGVYTPPVKMMFTSTDIGSGGWNQDTLLRAVAHETFHAMDDLAAGMNASPMPIWIAEGRALYSEYSLVGRQWIPGALNVGATDGRGQEVEKAYKTASIEKLLSLDSKTFMQNPGPNYAVIWSFTHFLMHGQDGKYRDRFMRFLAGCPMRSAAKDFERLVARAADLDAPYKAYVEEVFLPAVKASVNADRKAKGIPGEWK
ncbi:MAG: hypothetical protein FJ291_29320 [Planctomycetes bacterium]|nr:hypothetical protein [Planctomycetota bacterium]